MGCARCGRSKVRGHGLHPDAVTVTFNGQHGGIVWYEINNRRYAFGNRDNYRTQRVFPEDVQPLLAKYPGVFTV